MVGNTEVPGGRLTVRVAVVARAASGIGRAKHPERVSYLVLWGAFARGHLGQADPQTQALLTLIERDCGLFTETAASAWMGWLPAEAARRVARGFRAAVTPDIARAKRMLGLVGSGPYGLADRAFNATLWYFRNRGMHRRLSPSTPSPRRS
jgi:hypothetical protein